MLHKTLPSKCRGKDRHWYWTACLTIPPTCNLYKMFNQFLTTVTTFAVRETDVSRHNGGTSGAHLKPLRDDSALGLQMLERWA